MPAYTLYGSPTFPAVARVTIALDEAGFTDYEIKNVDVMGGENRTPEYTALNPYGKVPTLVTPCGTALYESRAIVKHLARTHPKLFSSLVPDPADEIAVARFEQAEQVEIAYFSEPMGKVAFELFYKQFLSFGEADLGIAEAGKRVVLQHLDVCEKALGTEGYMAGKEYGLVDIFYAPFFMRVFDCGMAGEVEKRPNVKAWWERVKSRPAVKKFLDATPTLEMYKEMVAKKA